MIPFEIIQQKIYVVRGRQVMLDKDLAELYGVETRILNQAVKRNKERFPASFLLILTRDEIRRISQIVISLKFSKSVLAFTEQGVAMLSSVLNSQRAIQVNIAIMQTFVRLRQAYSNRKELQHKLQELESRLDHHDEEIQSIFEAIRRLTTPVSEPERRKRRIGFYTETEEILSSPKAIAGIRAGERDIRKGKTHAWQEVKQKIKRSFAKSTDR